MQTAFAKSMAFHGAATLCASCLQGFTILPASGADPKLALVAHNKCMMHGFLLCGIAAAGAAGVFSKMGSMSSMISFLCIAGGSWMSFYGDVRASFLKVSFPLAVEKACAGKKDCAVSVNEEHSNSQMMLLSAVMILFGLMVLCTRMDMSAIVPRKAKSA